MTGGFDRRSFLAAVGALGTASGIPTPTAAEAAAKLRATADATAEYTDARYRSRHWSTQHNTYFEPVYRTNPGTLSLPFRAKSSSQLELIDVDWQEFGNPARDRNQDGCWRYSFRVTSVAAMLEPETPGETDGDWTFASNPEPQRDADDLDIETTIDVRAPKLWSSIRQVMRRNDGSGEDFLDDLNEDQRRRFGRWDHVAIAPRHGYSHFQLIDGNEFAGALYEVLDSGDDEDREQVRTFLNALASKPGEDTPVPNYSNVKDVWRGEVASGTSATQPERRAFNISRGLGGIIADVGAELTSEVAFEAASEAIGRLNQVLTIVSIVNNLQTIFEGPEEAGTAHYRGFEFEYPPDQSSAKNGPIGGHSVVFDAYVTPGETTFFKAQSKNRQSMDTCDLGPGDDMDRVINDTTWAVRVEAPEGPEASDAEKYGSVELKNGHPSKNTRFGPSPGINWDVDSVQQGRPVRFDAYDTALHTTDDVSYDWTIGKPIDDDWGDSGSPDATDVYIEAEGTGSTTTHAFEDVGTYHVILRATEQRDDEENVEKVTVERLEVSPAPQNAAIEEPSSLVAEVDETVTFDGSFEYDGADDTVTEYWRFPRAASSEYPGGIDFPGGIDVGGDQPTSDTVWLEGSNPSFQFTVTGTWEVAYVVQDEDGKTAMDFVTVYVVETQEALDAEMSDRVHADLAVSSETPARLGESVQLVASAGSYAEGELVRLGYDWDLEGTGTFRDLGEIAEEAGRSNVSGALSEGTVEMPRRGTFQEEGTRDVGVMVYAWDPDADGGENPLKANVDRVQFDVVPPEEYEARVTRIANPPISPGSGAPPETFEMFTAKFSEFTDHAVEYRWRFSGDGEEWDRVTETVGPVAHQYPDTGEYTVRLEVEYDNGHVSTDETTVWI
ncbi:PKD domain-containing protein [Haloarchaeobius baliensis]|uniref:PKD domain-containing protein n=1 Tax=Haloarchaeobius baliensis TaxID=1670458 RepID=UPI003F881D44